MADIELVIKISEKTLNEIKDNTIIVGSISSDIRWDISHAIANGTPLPKGHGRLIDADILEECKEVMNTIMNECKYAVRMDEVRNVPTIIEADKMEGENDN